MGTRSLTHVKDERRKTLVTIYRQYDGYPSGMGLQLAQFIASGTLVNGIGLGDTLIFNGMGCFAAALIAHLKDGPGNIYINRPNSRDCSEEYTYEIQPHGGIIQIRYSLEYAPSKPGKVTRWTEWYTAKEACGAFTREEE